MRFAVGLNAPGVQHRLGRGVLGEAEVVGVGPGRVVGLSTDPSPRSAPPNRTCTSPCIRLSTSPYLSYAATPSEIAHGEGMRAAR